MVIYKCKMCGGDLNIDAGTNIVKCDYCGTTQTVPSSDNDKKVKLFNRANRLRFNCEFDKAAGIYESIIAEFPEEAEAYWGLLLCKYGIEYVDDPSTGRKIPTCHRSSFDSIIDSDDFEMVMENADAVARKIYREEAKAIENIRRTIIEVSNKEEAYDIFICYKETDENGERTLDSVIAQDIYSELTSKGYRVFFSKISLEDKIGQEYEPYIFAALTSARVMLALGTDYEHFNSVWVKNEWSRFLQLIEKGEKKTLIPCYKNIDIYDLPKEFAKLQAQDMGKVGALQDLLRGIEKIIGEKLSGQSDETVLTAGVSDIIVETLKKAYGLLEEKDWFSAQKCLDTVLGYDPQNVSALIGCLMNKLRIPVEKELADCAILLEEEDYYNLALRFADKKTKMQLEEYNRSSVYNYAKALSKKKSKKSIETAIAKFESIAGWKDANEQVEALIKRKKAQKNRKITASIASVVIVLIAISAVYADGYMKSLDIYNNAVSLMEQGMYMEAEKIFKDLADFKDSADMVTECEYLYCHNIIKKSDPHDKVSFSKNRSKISSAILKLGNFIHYKDSQQLIYEAKFKIAENYAVMNKFDDSIKTLNELKEAGYKPAIDQIPVITQMMYEYKFNSGNSEYEIKNYEKAIRLFAELNEAGYKPGAERLAAIEKELYSKGMNEYNATKWGTAKKIFTALCITNYSNSSEMVEKCNKNISSEVAKFYGVWLEANNSWTNLKIDKDGVYYASQTEYKRGNWTKVSSYSYNEDTGILTFTYSFDDVYDAKVSGNKMTIHWINPKDQWDNDRFGNHNVFYRK